MSDVRKDLKRAKNESESSAHSDEESFVVLGRSPSSGELCGGSQYLFDSLPPTVNALSINNTPVSQVKKMTAPASMLDSAAVSLTDGSSLELTAEEIQTKVNELLLENSRLKETVLQNNLGLKQQLATWRAWQESSAQNSKHQKEMFSECQARYMKLQTENEELKKSLQDKDSGALPASEALALQALNTSLTVRVNSLQGQVAALNARNEHVMKSVSNNKKEAELISLTEKLNRQLETAERAKRQMTVDLEKLQAQKTRLERDVVIVKVELESQKQRTEAVENEKLKLVQALSGDPAFSTPLTPEVDMLRDQVKEQKRIIDVMTCQHEENMKIIADFNAANEVVQNHHKPLERYDDVNSWQNVPSVNLKKGDDQSLGYAETGLSHELAETRKWLAEEQAVNRDNVKKLEEKEKKYQNLLSEYQSALQDLEDLNNKQSSSSTERQNNAYYDTQVRGFTERIDSMTAKIMNLEDSIAQKDLEIHELKEKMHGLEVENESIAVLRFQMQVYQADFDAEREARENLAGEKERLAEDLRVLQRRNQQLLNEIKLSQQTFPDQQQPPGSNIGWNTISNPVRNHPRENTPPSPGPHDF